MNKKTAPNGSGKKQTGVQRLIQDLKKAEPQVSTPTGTDFEILSIAVEDAAKGIDISKRYPTLYQKLADDAALRETFLDALHLAEKDQKGELVPLPEPIKANLDFLKNLPGVMKMNAHAWQIRLQRTVQELESIFFPRSEVAYRSSDANLFEGPWFELLRTETEVEDILYSIALGCTPSEGLSDTFSVFLTISSEGAGEQFDHPLRARLQWGKSYDEQVPIPSQGRVKFPDIPLPEIFDSVQEHVNAELILTLEVNS